MPISNYLPDYVSPSGTLQQILQRRRDEARQAMLDKLSEEQTRSQMGIASRNADVNEGNLKLQRDTEKRLADSALEQQLQQRLGLVPAETPVEDLDPSLADYAGKVGRRRQTKAVTPQVSSSYGFPTSGGDSADQADPQQMINEEPVVAGPTLPGRDMVVTPDYMQDEIARNRMSDAQRRISEDPDMSELERTMILRQAGAIESLPEEAYAGPRSAVPISPSQRTPVPLGPRDVPVQQGYQPYPPASLQPKLYQVYRDNKWQKSDLLSPQEAELYTSQGFELRQGNTPVDPNLQRGPFDVRLVQQLNNAIRATNVPRNQRVQLINNIKLTLTGTANTSPEAKEFLNGMIDDLARRREAGQPYPTMQEVVARAEKNGATPDEIEFLISSVPMFLNEPIQ